MIRAKVLNVPSVAVFTWLTLSVMAPVQAADQTDIAVSALEFGGSLGKLLWVGISDQRRAATDGDRYTKLAAQVRTQIDLGRSSGALIASNFDVISTALVYSAAVDPEPLPKAIVGVAAWGAKKTGDTIGDAVLGAAQERARAVLAQGLKESGISAAELQTMTPEELKGRVADFQVGGAKLRDLLQDVPGAIPMLQAESIDLATNIGVAALAQTQGIGTDVAEIKADVAKTTADLTQYQTTVQNHLQRLEDGLGELNEDAKNANIKMNVLQTAVQGNTVVIQSLATISYSGWTTAQKLQAVQSGLFPDLTGPSKDAVIESLKSQQSVEVAASALSAASQDFGNLAQIAGNVGLPRDVVAGLQGAQVVAGSIARFATGDYLGAVAGLTSLVGLGGPDANAQRYAAMMSYLQQSFAQVNAKLDKVIDLQVKTLTAIAQLAKAQDDFRRKALGNWTKLRQSSYKTSKYYRT
jgi:hypothetical protein